MAAELLAAAETLNFLEVTSQIFETRYVHQIYRHCDSISRHNIVQCTPQKNADDPPFWASGSLNDKRRREKPDAVSFETSRKNGLRRT